MTRGSSAIGVKIARASRVRISGLQAHEDKWIGYSKHSHAADCSLRSVSAVLQSIQFANSTWLWTRIGGPARWARKFAARRSRSTPTGETDINLLAPNSCAVRTTARRRATATPEENTPPVRLVLAARRS